MDPNTRALIMGAAGGGEKIYVEDVFSTWLYTGTGATQTITNGIDLSGKGGLVWLKPRTADPASNSHSIFDTARGVNNQIYTNLTNAQANFSDGVNAFNTSGFSLVAGTGNASAVSYASWTFRKAAKFFDVVTYTGTGANRTIAHNLGSVPGCIIVKRTDTTASWQVYHRDLTNTEYLVLNTTAAKATGATRWNSTTPTSAEFSLGTDATVNASGGTYVAYVFAHDAGGFGDSGNDSVVKCGSFTTNASNGVTGEITLGWEPQWVMMKCSGTTSNWIMVDVMRGFSQTSIEELDANTSGAAAQVSGNAIYPTATGFGIANATLNASQSWIYIAIRRGPMKTPTDATKVFSAITSSSVAGTTLTTNFPLDFQISKNRVNVGSNFVLDRLRGVNTTGVDGMNGPYLRTNGTSSEDSDTTRVLSDSWSNVSFKIGSSIGGVSSIYYSFRRAPGFFDVVAYTGTNAVNQRVSHNLSAVPEIIIIKDRTVGSVWFTYFSSATSQFQYLLLSNTNAVSTNGAQLWGTSVPTSTDFGINMTGSGTGWATDNTIAYLFASCPGVSKVGSYTGTGTTLSVDCGFTAGARFVMIKRTDSTGDWYVWDTARGIVSGNDPYLRLNLSTPETTNTDYIDPLSSGFEISSTAPAAINASGGTYIYLSVA